MSPKVAAPGRAAAEYLWADHPSPDQKALVQARADPGETVHPGEHVTLDPQVARLYTRTTVEIRCGDPACGMGRSPCCCCWRECTGMRSIGIDSVRRTLPGGAGTPAGGRDRSGDPVLNVFGFLAMQRQLPTASDI